MYSSGLSLLGPPQMSSQKGILGFALGGGQNLLTPVTLLSLALSDRHPPGPVAT